MHKIKSVLIVGATHGNELSGLAFVDNHLSDDRLCADFSSKFESLQINWLMANKAAMNGRTRYIDEDLNRQFTFEKLDMPNATTQEHQLAQQINGEFGPKGDSKTDFVIDIHNTTSNMGPTLILLDGDEYHRALARFVKHHMPDAVMLVEDEKPYLEHHYLCTIGTHGVMIEVGPQPQGILRAQAYLQTQQMCELILQFCELSNAQNLPQLPAVDVYRFIELMSYPLNDKGMISAMIHPNLQDNDFLPLAPGDPIFLGFDGRVIYYQGPETVYPHFVGEAAYYHLAGAFATASKASF